MAVKKLELVQNEYPKLVGVWTNGEVRAVLLAALQWLDSLPLTMPEKQENEAVENG